MLQTLAYIYPCYLVRSGCLEYHMRNGGVLVGIFLGLLLLSWELAGVLAKGPKLDTISQMYWWVRDWTKRNTGRAGTGVLAAITVGFFGWLTWHLVFGG